jgi:putative transposase
VATLDRVTKQRGMPGCIYCDNGGEFCGRLMNLWAYHHYVTLAFSRPGKPTDHAHIESFNGSLWDECLNVHWFTDARDAQQTLDS